MYIIVVLIRYLCGRLLNRRDIIEERKTPGFCIKKTFSSRRTYDPRPPNSRLFIAARLKKGDRPFFK